MVCAMQSGMNVRWQMNGWYGVTQLHPSQQSVYMAFIARKNYKIWPCIIKKSIWGEVLLYRFWDCCLILKNVMLILDLSLLAKIHATVRVDVCVSSYILSVHFIFILFSFQLFSKSSVKFCHKKFLLVTNHSPNDWTWNQKCVTDEIWNPRACYPRLAIIHTN